MRDYYMECEACGWKGQVWRLCPECGAEVVTVRIVGEQEDPYTFRGGQRPPRSEEELWDYDFDNDWTDELDEMERGLPRRSRR